MPRVVPIADRYDHPVSSAMVRNCPEEAAHALDVPAYERLDTRDGPVLRFTLAGNATTTPGVQEHIAAGFPGLTLDGLETHVWGKEL